MLRVDVAVAVGVGVVVVAPLCTTEPGILWRCFTWRTPKAQSPGTRETKGPGRRSARGEGLRRRSPRRKIPELPRSWLRSEN